MVPLPEPDNKVAADFLVKWATLGPWVLTAIQPDKKLINTETFYPKQADTLRGWLKKHNGLNNIYFHVNPPVRALHRKAEREDIKSMDWLHVDIDPRVREDLDKEQARALHLLTDKLPRGIPPPTVVIFSGGGYQGFWRLLEPVEIGGDLTKAEEAKRYNQQLELDFGADSCHNIDRIMRLPGTVNIPDARKKKRGRTETLARLISFEDHTYPLSSFTKALVLQTSTELMAGGGVEVKIDSEVVRIEDVSELDKWDVPDRVKIVMVQGRHPDQPKGGDNSRSAWLFDFCCQMVRCKVPDNTIFSIITDSGWGISESVLALRSGAEKYALRQIQRARENAIDPKLAYFNSRYAVIKKLGGKCLVVTEVDDYALGRTRLMKMSLSEFEKGYENELMQTGEDSNGNPKFKPAGTWWRKHPKRRQFDTLTFAPEQETGRDCYNLWRGFAVQSIAGDCSLFMDHLTENVCGNNTTYVEYLLGWLARMVQRPNTPGQVAVVLRGGRGVGKTIFAKIIGRLFGRHYMQVSNSSHLIGNFNNHLRDLIMLFADEAFYAGDKRHESILKTLVTEDTMAVEAKGIDIETAPNYIHLIMASNDIHVIPAGRSERRFFVLDVGEKHQKDTAYFGAILRQMEKGGYEALLHQLRSHDLQGFNVRDVPTTEALQEQKLLSLEVDEEWWYQKLVQGQLLYDENGWPQEIMARALVEDYVEHGQRHHSTKRSSETKLGRFIKRVLPYCRTSHNSAEIEVPTGDGGWTRKKVLRALFYHIPSLAQCRTRWETLHGPSQDW